MSEITDNIEKQKIIKNKGFMTILDYYKKSDKTFLEYTKNNGKNSMDIYQFSLHLIRYWVKKISVDELMFFDPFKEFMIIEPKTLTSFNFNNKKLRLEIKQDKCDGYYRIMNNDLLKVYESNNKDKSKYNVYKYFNIANLYFVNKNGVVGVGYQYHRLFDDQIINEFERDTYTLIRNKNYIFNEYDGNQFHLKVIKIAINDDYLDIDPYEESSLTLFGLNHPLLYYNNKFYHFKPFRLFNEEDKENKELMNEIVQLGYYDIEINKSKRFTDQERMKIILEFS